MVATGGRLPDGRAWDELGWRDGLLIDDAHYLFFYAQTDARRAHRDRRFAGAPYRP